MHVSITCTITIKTKEEKIKTMRTEEKERRETLHVQQRLNEYIVLLLDNANQLLDSVVRYGNEYN